MNAQERLIHMAQWTDDCQGKKDFDGLAVLISTRYWPGYMTGYNSAYPERGLHVIPTNGPSAKATLAINHGGPSEGDEYGDYFVLAECEFDGADEDEVKGKVEVWVQEQFDRMTGALRAEFGK